MAKPKFKVVHDGRTIAEFGTYSDGSDSMYSLGAIVDEVPPSGTFALVRLSDGRTVEEITY